MVVPWVRLRMRNYLHSLVVPPLVLILVIVVVAPDSLFKLYLLKLKFLLLSGLFKLLRNLLLLFILRFCEKH